MAQMSMMFDVTSFVLLTRSLKKLRLVGQNKSEPKKMIPAKKNNNKLKK